MLRNEIDKHEQDQSVQHNRLLLLAFKEQRQAILSMKDQVVPDTERIVLRVKYDVLTGKEPIVPRFAHLPSRVYSEDCVVRGYKVRLMLETNDARPENQNGYGLFLYLSDGIFPCKVEYTFEVEHHDGKAASAKKEILVNTYDHATGFGAGSIISKAEIAAPDSPYVKDGYVTFKVTFKFV